MSAWLRTLCNLPYTQVEVRKIMAFAETEHVNRGGNYEPRTASVTYWHRTPQQIDTRHWGTPYVTFHFSWRKLPTLWCVEWARFISQDTAFLHLGELEQHALGELRHGFDLGNVGR